MRTCIQVVRMHSSGNMRMRITLLLKLRMRITCTAHLILIFHWFNR